MPELKFTNGLYNLQLDIVGFLAILGEASVLANAQVGALSRWTYLPRLLPAPQALIRVKRPERLEGSTGKVVGSPSGNIRHHINHVAHILHSEGEGLPNYHVRVVRLSQRDEARSVKSAAFSPLTFLSILGCVMSVALFSYSLAAGDGMSFLATIILSVLSPVIALGGRWTLELPERTDKRQLPPSDIIISYPHGAFLIVQKCSEDIARKLYWAPEKCNYFLGLQWYRLISLIGTLLLMGGVIALANASNPLQLAWAVAYMILNAAYWVVAALPQRWNWDLGSFHVEHVQFDRPEANATFTEALWHAIAVTRRSAWARTADIAPQTGGWDRWLQEAEEAARSQPEGVLDYTGRTALPKWDPRRTLTDLLSREAAEKAV